MQLPLQDFTALVRIQAAAAARACRTLMDVSVGSVLRAVLEANASVALWMQWLIMEVLATTRAATSRGVDLDSWVADFGVSRLGAVAAHGEARFSRITPGLRAEVPVGAVVRTGAGADAQAFRVVADPQRPWWSGTGYVIAAEALEVVAPIQALSSGRAGNVQAGVLRLLSTAVPGVDAVVNDYPASGGLDAEADEALRARFALFIDSRTRATRAAVEYAVQSVQQGLQYVLADRVDSAGAVRAGHFTVVVDDGSGAASDALLGRIGAAIEAVRPIGGTYSVRRPGVIQANVSMRVQAPADALPVVQAAVWGFINALPIGGGVVISRLIQVAHEADARVVRVSEVTVNGAGADLAPPVFGKAAPGLVTVLP